jgi:hypothetical protein
VNLSLREPGAVMRGWSVPVDPVSLALKKIHANTVSQEVPSDLMRLLIALDLIDRRKPNSS